MEKLSRRSDGIFETASGLFAVSLKRSSGSDGENKWFDFRAQSWSDPIRIRWPARDEIAVIEAPYATLLMKLRYGTTITEAQAAAWNDRVDEVEAITDAPALDPAAQPQGAQAGNTATLIPAEPADAASEPAEPPVAPSTEPTPEEIAAAAQDADVKEESEIGTEADIPEGEAASLVPPAPSPEDQVDETEGKPKKKRTLS